MSDVWRRRRGARGAGGSRLGRLDVAVANAGITLHCDFLDYRPEDFDRLLAVNLRGSFFLAQAAARRFREQGTPGRILFLSSVTGHMAIRQMAPYGMTKSALEALARNLSLEMAPHGITVNAVAPGATITPRTVSDEKLGGRLGGGHPERPRGDRRRRGRGRALPAVGRGVARHRPEPGGRRRLDRDGRGAGNGEALVRGPGVAQVRPIRSSASLDRRFEPALSASSLGRASALACARDADAGDHRLERHLVLGALGDDEVGVALRGLHELEVHRAHRVEVLPLHRLEAAARAPWMSRCRRRRMRTSASVSMKSLMSISRRSGSSARIRMPSRITTGLGVSGSGSTRRE